jgi:MFS family permease
VFKRPTVLAPLRYETFRSLWLATLASNFGGLIQSVGAAWLMTSISTSVDLVALVQASSALPVMLLALIGGAIADGFDRRKVILFSQIFMIVVSLVLAVCAYTGLITPWLLLTLTFLVGCGNAINNPSWQASVGDVVDRADLPGAVALNSIGFNLSRSAGPAIGGLIVAAAGAAATFAVNALSYIPLLIVLLRWKPNYQPSTLPRETMGRAIVAGMRYVAMSPSIGRVLVRSFLFGFGASSFLALLPVVAAGRLGGGPLTYGLLLGSFGIGAVAAAFVSARLRARFGSETVVRLAFLGFAIGTAALGLSPYALLTAVGGLLAGACWILSLSLFNVTVQLSAPRWVVGRALSIYQTFTFGGMALGAWLWGVLAEVHGTQFALSAAALTLLAGGAVGLWIGLPRQQSLNLDPLNRWTEPAVALDLEPRSGPIVVSIEYTINPVDVPAYLELMQERKRIRQRDGARHWTLMRDLADPTLWVESYRLPTWLEYVRHNMRTTHEDAALRDRIRALHSAEAPPRVTRHIERPPSWFSSVAARNTVDPP